MSTLPMSPAAREIARVIKARVDESDWTQTTLAPQVGVDQSQLSKMLRGIRPFTIDQLYAICGPLGLSVVAVVREAEAVVAARASVADGSDEGQPPLTQFLLWEMKRRGFGAPDEFIEKAQMSPATVWSAVHGQSTPARYSDMERALGLPAGVLVAIRDGDATTVETSGLSGDELDFVLPLLPPNPPTEPGRQRGVA